MRQTSPFSRYFLMLLMITALAACSSDKDDKFETEKPVDVLYNQAATAMDEGQYDTATKYFEEVERQHPYSQWATQAQLMSAYSSYLDQRYDEAVLALDRFIELHPGSKDIDYAYYLKALCYYEQISDVARDQEMTEEALKALETLVRLYPESQYARDATLKRDLTLDHLAGKEMEIGRYYLNRGHVNAAMNRFRTVVKDYQTTTHVAEALHRLVEAYLSLGLKEEATNIAAVLGYNYPGSVWYKRSFELLDDQQRKRILENRDFVDRTIDSIFKPD
ncbi:MAG TPA: outer membrane protein assembly factor BamD [Alphaproteobacteria bacterium]|jgi:outer membrane protein assembly factor BamD|nr:outer membrane protein assembly factor BamD [Micavibrio sp.]HQX26649.1 outer membrane protein assembly factor BamD [Alphaproteobacteria bacterium]